MADSDDDKDEGNKAPNHNSQGYTGELVALCLQLFVYNWRSAIWSHHNPKKQLMKKLWDSYSTVLLVGLSPTL